MGLLSKEMRQATEKGVVSAKVEIMEKVEAFCVSSEDEFLRAYQKLE